MQTVTDKTEQNVAEAKWCTSAQNSSDNNGVLSDNNGVIAKKKNFKQVN